MVDLASSLVLVFVALGVGAAFAAFAWGERFARVERDGGSALLGQRVMSAGYWALRPVGAFLAALGVTPNAVTLAGLALGLAAGVAMATGHFGLGALLAAVAALSDGLDGMVARITHKGTWGGKLLDAASDRYQEFFFLLGLAVAWRHSLALLALPLAAVVGSMMTSYVSALSNAQNVPVARGAMRRPERAAYLTVGAALTPIAASLAEDGPLASVMRFAPMAVATLIVAAVANVSAARRLAELMRAVDHRDPPEQVDEGGADEAKPDAHETSLPGMVVRHQAVAALSTALDFATMITVVEALRGDPVTGTALGAMTGAASNFVIAQRGCSTPSPRRGRRCATRRCRRRASG
ncbi:MAG: CDP-alcohol phosphatidyltransferase family protein [Polyangiales bacterium]